MPVPLPTADEVLLRPPDAAEARHDRRRGRGRGRAARRAHRAAADADRGGHRVDDGLRRARSSRSASSAREEFAAGHRATATPGFRVAHGRTSCSLAALVLVPLPRRSRATGRGVRRASSASTTPCLRVARRYASRQPRARARSTSSAAATWRRGIRRTPSRCTRRGALDEAWEQCAATTRSSRGAGLRCADCPRARSASAVAKFYDARGFAFPGLPRQRAAAARAARLGARARPTTARRSSAELEVFGFISRANDDPRAFSSPRDGHQPVRDRIPAERAPACSRTTAVTCRTKGMPVRLADAMRRGALCGAHAGGRDLLARRLVRVRRSPGRRGAGRVRDRREVGAGDRGRFGRPVGTRRHLAVPVRVRRAPRPRPRAASYDSYGATPPS